MNTQIPLSKAPVNSSLIIRKIKDSQNMYKQFNKPILSENTCLTLSKIIKPGFYVAITQYGKVILGTKSANNVIVSER
jgi:hypothetical protein